MPMPFTMKTTAVGTLAMPESQIERLCASAYEAHNPSKHDQHPPLMHAARVQTTSPSVGFFNRLVGSI